MQRQSPPPPSQYNTHSASFRRKLSSSRSKDLEMDSVMGCLFIFSKKKRNREIERWGGRELVTRNTSESEEFGGKGEEGEE